MIIISQQYLHLQLLSMNWPNRCAIKTELHSQRIFNFVFKGYEGFSHNSEWISDTCYMMDATK